MTICLAMIVRDESETIETCIASVHDLIDRWCIIDTGSQDDTPRLVRKALKGIPGTLHRRPWRNHADNRTELLELARRQTSNYLLLLDGDHTVTVTGDPPAFTADSYLLRINPHSARSWRLPLLVRAAHPFQYRGVAHVALYSDQPTITEPTDWIAIDGGKGATTEKLKSDRVALEAQHLRDPADTRTVFYLARTYDDLDMVDEAIRFYRIRADMNGFPEERYYSRFRLGCLLGENISFAEAAPELLRAWQERPHRVEALRALANLANSVADKYPVPDDLLFVNPHAYRQEVAA